MCAIENLRIIIKNIDIANSKLRSGKELMKEYQENIKREYARQYAMDAIDRPLYGLCLTDESGVPYDEMKNPITEEIVDPEYLFQDTDISFEVITLTLPLPYSNSILI